jgi:tryptophan-rich hypothetical protein
MRLSPDEPLLNRKPSKSGPRVPYNRFSTVNTVSFMASLPSLPATGHAAQRHPLQVAKLLRSKWTAVVPLNKEKHFIVTALVAPEPADAPVELVTLEAVLTGRSFNVPWRELNDAARWLAGWARS